MDKDKDAHPDNQAKSSQTTLTFFSQWINQSKSSRLWAILAFILGIAFFASGTLLAIRQFENSWYSIYFISVQSELEWTLILIISITALRNLFIIAFSVLAILWIVAPKNSNFFDYLDVVTDKMLFWGTTVIILLIGLQNLVLYSVIGWEYINITTVGEGIAIFLLCTSLILVIFGSKFQSKRRTVILESLFNLVLLLFPITVILTYSIGGFKSSPVWLTITSVVINLLLLIIGVDELKGRPSIYTHMVTTFSIFAVGHASTQTLRKRSAEALANALLVYKRLPLEQQETLAKWILDNNEPSFANRFWAIAKIVVSTALLTMLVQEPAIILFKWLLKTIFGYSY